MLCHLLNFHTINTITFTTNLNLVHWVHTYYIFTYRQSLILSFLRTAYRSLNTILLLLLSSKFWEFESHSLLTYFFYNYYIFRLKRRYNVQFCNRTHAPCLFLSCTPPPLLLSTWRSQTVHVMDHWIFYFDVVGPSVLD